MIAGPRVLEHMVDTVLYLEGDRGHQFRVLRAVKNRFGPTDEIGVFEMTEKGLMEVADPWALFLADRQGDTSGAAVFAGMEGTRPVLVEIQALVAPTSYGTPRRAVIGWDSGRLAMVLAVLEARYRRLAFGMNDVYLNVAGGLRITEPAADLAVAAAPALRSLPRGNRCRANAWRSAKSAYPARFVRSRRPKLAPEGSGETRVRRRATLPRRVARGDRPPAAAGWPGAGRKSATSADLVARFTHEIDTRST